MTPPYNCITNILANEDVDTWIPPGRTVPDMPSYFANDAVANVRDFGAIGNGTTDDATAFQSAIDSLPYFANPKVGPCGGVIYIPRGKYKIGTRLQLHRGVRMVGESRESSQLISFSANGVLQYVDVGNYLQDEIAVENLSICQDSSVTPTSGAGIEIALDPELSQSTSFKGDNLIVEGTYFGV